MMATSTSTSTTPIRVLLIGVNKPRATLAGELAEGLLQEKYRGRLEVTILSRPLTEATTASKRQVLDDLRARGVNLVHGDATTNGIESLVPLMQGQDVVVSSLGGRAADDQQYYIEAARRAGVKWFIPSTFGFDYELNGGRADDPCAFFAAAKLADMDRIRASGMDWTVFNTGAFAEYMTMDGHPAFGVHTLTRTIVYPNTGEARLVQTSLRDVGAIVADAIVTGRGRNQFVYTGADAPSYEEYAALLEKVTGEKWTRIVRSTAESAATAAGPFSMAKMFALFELAIGSTQPSPATWPIEKTYNHQYDIPMRSTEEVLRERFAQPTTTTTTTTTVQA